MNCDLNIRTFYAGDPLKDQQLIQLLTTTMEENYNHVAITTYVKDANLQKQHSNSFKPYSDDILTKRLSSNITQFNGKFKQYSRLTLETGDVKFLHQIKPENSFLVGYDLIAIKPRSEAVFGHLCTTLTYFDIVTFDCFEKLPFIPKSKICQLLLEKNVQFELNYGDAVQDPNKRRQFISNASIIIKATKGKNIIMSSDTANWIYHRSPYDLIALGIMIGLSKDQATKTVTDNAILAIKHATHRRAFKGTICEATQQDISHFEEAKQKIQENRQTQERKNKSQEQIIKKIKLSQEAYQ